MNIRHRFAVSCVVALFFLFIRHVMMMTTPQISYDVLYTHAKHKVGGEGGVSRFMDVHENLLQFIVGITMD